MGDESRDAELFAFNSHAKTRLAYVGRRQIAVSLIDNVLHHPDGVAALGFAQPYVNDRSNLYPGMRAPMPESFSGAFRAWLTPILTRNGIVADDRAIYRDESFFSVVTTASADLLPIQSIPHYDSTDPNLLAVVIYLCGTRHSGTSFYRHRRTGYEAITRENQANYKLSLDRDMQMHGVPKREYICGDSLMFEAVYSNEAKFNSALIYPSNILHAANIEPHFEPPKDKKEWRLTVTALLRSA